MGSNSERQPHIHAAGVPLDRRIEKLINFRERHYFIEFPPNLGFGHAEDCAVKKDVFTASQFRMEPGPNLQQAGDAASQAHPPFAGARDPAQDLQQGGFSGAVAANDPHHLTLLDFKGDIL